MSTGILAMASLCLVLSQGPSDITYHNQRSLGVPVNFQENRRGEIRELLLFASTDQGRNWQMASRIAPDKNTFAFYANKDGPHWLRVAVINKAGIQEPDDKTLMTSPLEKFDTIQMVIDTLKPIIRTINGQRVGDEICINWDIQEDNPDRAGIRLDYQAKDSPGSNWTQVPVSFAPIGQARFRPGNTLPVVVRLTVRDLAGNQSFDAVEIAGTSGSTSFAAQGNGNPMGTNSPQPLQSQEQTLPGTLQISGPSNPPVKNPSIGISPPPPVDPPNYRAMSPGTDVPPGPVTAIPRNVVPPPAAVQFAPPSQPQIALPAQPQPQQVSLPAKAEIVADSTKPPITVDPVKTPASKGPVAREPMGNEMPVANSMPARRPLPPLLYVNNHQVSLEYELKRVGPSGIGGVELWLTRNDGETWEQYAYDGDVQTGVVNGRQKRTFDFRDNKTDVPFSDGVYGLILAVKNRAGLGRKPRPGDVPEIRIEIDTQAPISQLYKPVPDPERPDHVLLKWNTEDKNLAAAPINLEYAEKREGPWQPIKLDLENKGHYTTREISGDYSWQLPPNIPVQVYLRLRVRDKAGNESVAVTPEPQYVDLMEPEGALIGVQPVTRNP